MSVDRCQLSVAELETRYDMIQWYGKDRVWKSSCVSISRRNNRPCMGSSLKWNSFPQSTIGKQLVNSAGSIGANTCPVK